MGRQQLTERQLEPEGSFQWSFLERWQVPRFATRARVSRRRDDLIARDRNGVVRVWSGAHTPPHFLFQEGSVVWHQAVAAVVANPTRRIRYLPVVAPPCDDGVGLALCFAEQRHVLPNCQRKHDREQSCSKHVILV
jgi:hypothetical protein